MTHKDKKIAKSIDMPGRSRKFTDAVYSGEGNAEAKYAILKEADREYDPPSPEYTAFIGEMHGHTNLSDGKPNIDEYFVNLKERANLDFGAVSDHDHGGVGKSELWVGSPSKWDEIKDAVKRFDEPGKFTALLAYERDSYPFYNNMVIYYGSHDGELIRGEHDGEITAEELGALLAREDVFCVPHDTYSLSSGADFGTIPYELLTPFVEIYSRGDATEYMGNPANDKASMCEGGYWQDALRRGAKMGVIAGSDDHSCNNGITLDAPYPYKFPGLTGVWAEENTLNSIFSALKAKRCYGFMGGRMEIDFRINRRWMGETIKCPEDGVLTVWYNVRADAPIKSVTVVKNCRNYCIFTGASNLFFDYKHENPTDYYYLRVELADGRFGWTSPIWVENQI